MGRTKRVDDITKKYEEDIKLLLDAQIPKSCKLILFRMCINHQLLFHMFVDNSIEDDWKLADDVMKKFFREVIGR